MNYSATSSSDAQPFIGIVENTVCALRLVRAAKLGIIPRIVRRLNDSERQHLIVSGAVLVFSVEESGIRRWTDGRLWSPSRIVGNFLVYREMHEKTGNRTLKSRTSPDNSPRRADIQWNADANRLRSDPSRPTSSLANGTFKPSGLIKKTITVTIEGTDLHLISYYTQEDIVTNRLKRLASRPDIANLALNPRIFRLGSFRSPPKVINGPDGKPMIAPEAEEVDSPQENLADGSSYRASGSPEYSTTSSVGTNTRQIQSPHQDGNSFNTGYSPDWRREYESTHTMVDQYRQGPHWVTTPSSAETRGIDGYPDHSGGTNAQVHARSGEEQNWRESPELQYPEMYTQSPLDTTVHKQREVGGPGDGRVYDENVVPPTLYVDQSPGQRTHTPQNQSIGSAYLLGWPTSSQRHEYSSPDDSTSVLSTSVRSKPFQSSLALPSTCDIYSTGDHWTATTSSTNEYAISSLRQQTFPDPGQTYYTYTDPERHYKVEE